MYLFEVLKFIYRDFENSLILVPESELKDLQRFQQYSEKKNQKFSWRSALIFYPLALFSFPQSCLPGPVPRRALPRPVVRRRTTRRVRGEDASRATEAMAAGSAHDHPGEVDAGELVARTRGPSHSASCEENAGSVVGSAGGR